MQNSRKEALHDAREQIKYLSKNQTELKMEIKRLRYKLMQEKKFLNNKFDIIQKMKLINMLFNISKKQKAKSSVVGSFPRQMIEFSMHSGNNFLFYGKPYNRDVDYVVFDSPQNISEYDKFIEEVTKNNKFFNYSIVSLKDVTIQPDYNSPPGKRALENIPHHKLCLIDFNTNHKIDIDFIGWKPKSVDGWTEYDFDVNSLKITEKGIMCSNYISIYSSIVDKVAECVIDIEGINKKAQSGENRPNFKKYMAQIIYFLTERLKIVNDGYIIKSKKSLPSIYIEEEETCPVSKCEAPYPVVELECNHFITLPHLGYLLINDDKCPHCDKDIKLMMQSSPSEYNFSLNSRCISSDAKTFLRRAITQIYKSVNGKNTRCNCEACRLNSFGKKKLLKIPMYYS